MVRSVNVLHMMYTCCISWKPIMDHIDSKYDEYLNAESRVTRGAQLDDHRVHCCLYFITPSGHGLV